MELVEAKKGDYANYDVELLFVNHCWRGVFNNIPDNIIFRISHYTNINTDSMGPNGRNMGKCDLIL